MYDMLGHHRLRREDVALNMPRELAVVTLASYRWPRFISLDGLVAPPLMPGRGIMPGCP